MSDRTEALEALVTVYPSVIRTMPKEFDSHQFILKLAHHHQQLYVKALATFAETGRPFQIVHGEIAKRLLHSELINTIGDRNSEDIFLQVNSAALWRKV